MRIVMALAVLCGAAWGQEKAQEPKAQDDPPKKPEIRVFVHDTPFNEGKEPFNVPKSVTGKDSKDLREQMPRSLPHAVAETPGASIQKTGPNQGSPYYRGWTGFRNLLLIDGIRLNNSVFREGPNQYWGTVDALLLDRLEISRGPSSVLYGSDSIGATVYAYTMEPDLSKPGYNQHGRQHGRYASAEDSYMARQEFSGNVDGFGWVVGGTYRDFHDMSGGRDYGKMTGTAYDEYDADLKFVFRTSEKGKLILAAQRHRTDDASRWHSTADSRPWHGTTAGTDVRRDFDQERDLYYLQYHVTTQGGFVDAFKFNLSAHRQAEKEDRTTAALARQVREHEVLTPAAWVQAGKQTDLGYLTAGGEYYQDRVDSKGHNWSAAGALTMFDRGNVADEATYDLYGVFLQDEFSHGDLDVTAGIRWSGAAVDAEEVDPVPGGTTFLPIDENYSAATGSLRLLYHVTTNWNAILGWGMGFRAPSLSDSTGNSLVLSGATELPVEGLDPEIFHTFDAGLRAKYETWEAGAFAFYTLIDDMITRVPTAAPGVFTKDNIGDGYVYGFEVDARVHLTEDVTAFADWGYSKGEVDQVTTPPEISEQPLGKVGPSLAHLRLRHEPKGGKVWVEGVVTAARHQRHLAPSEGTADTQRIPPESGTPGYTVYTLRGGWAVDRHLTLTAAVENLSDKDYRVHGSGQNEPGTNFVLGVDVRF